jgi:hypothetical protein
MTDPPWQSRSLGARPNLPRKNLTNKANLAGKEKLDEQSQFR